MKKTLMTIMFAALLFPAVAVADSIVPKLIGYQGKLTDAGGAPKTGDFDFRFIIRNDSEIERWSETQAGIPVQNGLYTVVIGTANPVNPLNLAFDENYLLEVQVKRSASTDSFVVVGKQPLLSSPYALFAATATYALSSGGSGGTEVATNLKDGQSNAIPYQSSPNNTTFLLPGTNGQVLSTRGAVDSPQWINQDTISAGSAASLTGNINPGQINAGPLPANVVVSSITSRNYFNDVKVSSAIFADNTANAGSAASLTGNINPGQINAGPLPANVVVSSITSRNYFNDVKVSSAIFADNTANAGSAASLTGNINSGQINAGPLPANVVVSSITSRNYFNDVKVSSAIFADSAGNVANAGTISGVISSTQIAAGSLPANVVVSSITSRNYFNDVKVSSAIYADGAATAATAAALSGNIDPAQINGGALPADVIVSSVAANSEITVSSMTATKSITANEITATGFIQIPVMTDAELQAIDPLTVGRLYYNSTTNHMVISTGTAQGDFAEISFTP